MYFFNFAAKLHHQKDTTSPKQRKNAINLHFFFIFYHFPRVAHYKKKSSPPERSPVEAGEAASA